MTMKNTLLEELNSAVADWVDDFEFQIEQTEAYDNEYFFYVTVKLKRRNIEQHFSAKVKDDRDLDHQFCYMDYNEDAWEMISERALFVWLFFDLVDSNHVA